MAQKLATDRDAILAALGSLGLADSARARIVLIRDKAKKRHRNPSNSGGVPDCGSFSTMSRQPTKELT